MRPMRTLLIRILLASALAVVFGTPAMAQTDNSAGGDAAVRKTAMDLRLAQASEPARTEHAPQTQESPAAEEEAPAKTRPPQGMDRDEMQGREMPDEEMPHGMMHGEEMPGRRMQGEMPAVREIPQEPAGMPEEHFPSGQAEEQGAGTAQKVSADALQALSDLSNRLRGMHDYSVSAELAWEQVLKSGEKITALEDVWADVAPGRLRLTILSPGRERVIFYDGRHLTFWGPLTRYYATEEFDGNLTDLTLYLAKKHNFELPLADLFLWGHEPIDIKAITEANYVGRDRVGDRLCDHFAYRQKDVDWQIWTDTEGTRLPCRYMIVDLTDPAHPVWQATFRFDEDLEFADRRFTFEPPEDAVEIPFRSTDNAQKKPEQ